MGGGGGRKERMTAREIGLGRPRSSMLRNFESELISCYYGKSALMNSCHDFFSCGPRGLGKESEGGLRELMVKLAGGTSTTSSEREARVWACGEVSLHSARAAR